VGFVVDKVALGQVFSEYFGFPCQLSSHRLLHTHHLSAGAGTIGHLLADVPSGLSLTPPQETKKKKLKYIFKSELLFCYSLHKRNCSDSQVYHYLKYACGRDGQSETDHR
jgi:hypothetical protein